GLARDGVYLPRELLLDQLRKSVDSDKVKVKDLLLSDEKGTVILVSNRKFDAEITVDFRFLSVDWPNRTIWMTYNETAKSASDTLLGRIFGTVAISVFEAASGSNQLESAVSGKPYFTLEENRIGIMLDKIPSLEKPLAARVGHVKLFDLIGIRSVKTEKDRIHVALGLV
nr:hypothetical protein [Burkholderiales bacterium]